MNLDILRLQLKQQRQQLSQQQQSQAAAKMVKHLSRTNCYKKAQHIALYLPVKGEADPRALFIQNSDLKKKFYLPVLSPIHDKQLDFVQWDYKTQFKKNIYAIPEPLITASNQILIEQLDLVVMPLLAFDASGNRLGMGGGYYDRSFAFKQQNPALKTPLLVGYAYQFQQQNRLLAQAWDIPLDAYVTETQFKKT